MFRISWLSDVITGLQLKSEPGGVGSPDLAKLVQAVATLSPTTASSSSPPSTAADEQHQQHVHSSGYGQYGENVQVKSEQE